MDVVEAIRQRKSVRGFKPDPVPKALLKEILEIAVRAPSSVNAQPWEFAVVTGDVLERIKQDNVDRLLSNTEPDPDLQSEPWHGAYRQRQVELAKQIFRLMGIAREDRQKRAEWAQRGVRFFDAPAAIIVYVDRSLSESRPLFDTGCVSQTICLAAIKYGLGTCIEGQGVHFPDVIRKHAGLPESKRIVTSIAIGYPDWDYPANKLETEREAVDNLTMWCGFD